MAIFCQKLPPHVSRLLELSNDIEKNPGPPKVVKNGLISSKMAPPSSSGSGGKNPGIVPDKASSEPPLEINNFEDLKQLVEKQNELIKAQKSELEVLRKQMEKNVHLTQDFQSELSEIRKNWQNLNENKSSSAAAPISGISGGKNNDKSIEDVLLRLEALSSAYTDIQDRLYELDKSWKNNLMIYGVPCCDGEEDDPIITEEKVILFYFLF